jgi:PAS domain S-box-containing protein
MIEGSADTRATLTAEDDPVRLQLLRQLKRSEERYHSLVENADDAVIAIRGDGVITGFNRKAEQMFGYGREEVLGKSVTLLAPPRMRELQQRMFDKFCRTGKLYIIGKTLAGNGLRKDGREFPLEGTTLLVEEDGAYTLTILIRDISERRKMEELILQSEKLKSMGEFAGGVAHNFNNILSVIMGRTQLLRRNMQIPPDREAAEKFIEELKKNLEIIEKASIDGANTVKRIQDFSGTARVEVQGFTAVNVNEIVEQALECTRPKWHDDAWARGISISIKKDLSPLPLVRGNASELRAVFVNLINNAVDALPRGGLIRVKTYSGAGQVVGIVEDSGVGMSREVQGRIFDPFFTTKGVQSTGLGMSVSHGIITRHHGTITVESVENRGTTCCLKFPVYTGAPQEERQASSLPEKARKACILVVEDEEEVRELLKDILTDGGHEVEFSSNGQKGLELFQEKKFDLVFTDLGMPGMSGWQVAEKIKQLSSDTPVALITGWEVKKKKQELKKNGVDVVVKKPFRVDEILRLVQEWMAERDNHASVPA